MLTLCISDDVMQTLGLTMALLCTITKVCSCHLLLPEPGLQHASRSTHRKYLASHLLQATAAVSVLVVVAGLAGPSFGEERCT